MPNYLDLLKLVDRYANSISDWRFSVDAGYSDEYRLGMESEDLDELSDGLRNEIVDALRALWEGRGEIHD